MTHHAQTPRPRKRLLFWAALLVAVAPTSLVGAGLPGPQVLVNTSRSGYQFSAAIGMNPAGNFVVAWISQGGAAGDEYVFTQRFNPDGVPAGPEIRVDDPNFQPFFNPKKRDPGVAVDADGNFVIVWAGGVLFSSDQYNYAFQFSEIYGQRFDSSGARVGGNFLVNTMTAGAQEQPAVAIDGPGHAVVAWTGFGDGNGTAIRAQRFDFTRSYVVGNEFVGSEFLVNSFTNGNQFRPSVAMNPGVPGCPPPFYCLGGPADFCIVWEGLGSGNNFGIFARRFDGGGAGPLGSQFQVNTTSGSDERPAAGMDEDGNLVVAWHGDGSRGNGIFAQRFLPNGTPRGGEFQVAAVLRSRQFLWLSIGVGASGKFAVAWNDLPDNVSLNDAIFARDFDANGAPQGAQFQISQGGPFYRPATRMDAAGNFVVAYEGGNDGSFHGIYARRAAFPTLYIHDASIVEGNSGTTNTNFAVTLSPASTQPVTVSFATTNHSATAGADYHANSGTLTFAAGTTSTQIVVRVIGDTQPEADQSFYVVLNNPVNAPIARSKGVGTILNDDACPQPTLSATMRGTNCNLRFEAASNCSYHLEYKNALNDPSWRSLHTLAGLGGTVTVTDTNATTRTRFYRAWVQ
jgi:hypothetical protein